MATKQISLSLPERLFQVSSSYAEAYGYRSLQELLVDLLRQKMILENVERYHRIEERMKKKKGMRRLDQKSAKQFVKRL